MTGGNNRRERMERRAVVQLIREKPENRGGERRASACLRACEGIPTDLLEKGIILRLIAACIHVSDPRVREILEELVVHRLRRDELGRRDC
jgi:hypothetical protein